MSERSAAALASSIVDVLNMFLSAVSLRPGSNHPAAAVVALMGPCEEEMKTCHRINKF